MKKKILLSVSLALISFTSLFAQTNDINQLSTRVDNIENNMTRFHKQYSTGTGLLIASCGINLISTGIYVYSLDNGSNHFQYQSQRILPVFMAIGGALSLCSFVIQIDSHKFFNKARFGITENGATVSIPLNKQ